MSDYNMHDRSSIVNRKNEEKEYTVLPWKRTPEAERSTAMTVCIAALANNSRAIVLVADKALTYGVGTANPAQGESDINKIVPIGKSGWNALIAGSPGIGDQILSQASTKINKIGLSI